MIARAAFFAGYRSAWGRLAQSQVDGLTALLGAMDAEPLPELSWTAYFLATVKHECADRWLPITEFGKRAYFDKYEPGTKIGKALGNTLRGDGFTFRGRGFVQLTGRANYAKMGDLLGIDLLNNPDLALDPVHAYHIAVVGMLRGIFTGRKLADYLPGDYVGARRIINGTDRAELIAGYARAFEALLGSSQAREAPLPAPTPDLPTPEPVVAFDFDALRAELMALRERLAEVINSIPK